MFKSFTWSHLEKGQGVIEYMPTLTLIGTFAILLLTGVSSAINQNLSVVSRCLESGGPNTHYATTVLEPAQNNAQHVMIQYPLECQEEVLEMGTSSLVVELGTDASYLNAFVDGTLNGTFNAWCVDYGNRIKPGKTYDAPNYNNMSGSVDRPENLPLVYWLVNYNWQQNGYEIMDVQGAIWLLIDDKPVKKKHLGPRAEELARLAIDRAGDANTDPTIRVN